MTMRNIKRRRFLQTVVGGLAMSALRPAMALAGDAPDRGFCFMLGNHWSYIGIGWQLGIESCALSVLDSLNVADETPHVKTCINLDARAYEFLAQEYPLLCQRLKKYLAEDKVELIGGTYSQPMGTLFSGESGIRQIVVGHEVIRKSLGVEIESFLEEEEFSHPQVPQMLNAAGIQYASLAQHDTWGYAGCPELPLNVFYWQGIDGSKILCHAKNSIYSFDGALHDLPYFSTPEGLAELAKLQQLGKPCIPYWIELGWEDPEQPRYKSLPKQFAEFSAKNNVEYVTLRGYLKEYGGQARESIYLNLDKWKKLLPWGIGGDQIRVNARKIEAVLLAAERFDAVSSDLGAKSNAATLQSAWRNLLTAQSHDVNLCELSRWQGDRMTPTGMIEDHHGLTWGSIGYRHLDEALKEGRAVLASSLSILADRVSAAKGAPGSTVVVFNPCNWPRTSLARTGKVYVKDGRGKHVSIVNSGGESVPFQLERTENDVDGNLAMIDVTFLAEDVPSVGYDTYQLKFTTEPVLPPKTALTVDEEKFQMENGFVRIRLDPTHGTLISLVEKESGKEFISAGKFSSPAFHGQPNMKYPFLDRDPDTSYDSSTAKGSVMWLGRGPLRATLKAVHRWKQLTFETRVSLFPHSANVEVLTRILTRVPPATDPRSSQRPGEYPQAERDIKNGYWLSFAPGFDVDEVYRDFPLGVEATKNERLHGLTFADLTNSEQGLLIVHSGCQYFRKEKDGTWSNLVMREWESVFNNEYGFPNFAEFTHSLRAHGAEMDNAERARAAAEFDNKFLIAISNSQRATLPGKKSFVRITPDNVLLSAFRKASDKSYEIRVLETAGESCITRIDLGFAASNAVEVDLKGRVIGKPMSAREISLPLRAWQFRTLRIT
jgi:alpha-mannosidase